ncbi:uncharacterized protein LACBIDRAFT_300221 [Laccaria bicolor S238N-H82]|uniref:Predicted protein n=1 Tax=Laccaria bicolor (strain S238N-H82 / ATCC MYA-4686) TaxID=486041 RepID=B0E3V3_LACBS|nr:uncharacterized protein LACBIDRAFT_300221 [Laccaria bicolor S238N-H82]EDQ98479.1 predicted protein [Laccaria bicolor S238N-H82]|eukprot:XP_001890871.1 predicted protein [Laccaria bicolor S238N-H82]
MALNASAMTIPAEAMDYRSRKADDHRATGPTGVFLEMEWALDTDWYDRDASWRPFIPTKSDDSVEGTLSESGQDWFFDLGSSIPWEQGDSEGFIIPGPTRSAIDADLVLWSWLIDEITTHHPFPCDSARPRPYDQGILFQGFSSCEELQAAGAVAKRTAVDYLGFLTWWTVSISRWEADLDAPVADQIKSLRLERFRRRGVLVDLEQHWQEINVTNLLRHGVPIAYPWSPSLSCSPRFRSFAPRILQAYDERRISTGGEVHSTDFDDWSDEFAVIRQYDRFFQETCVKGRPDPDVRFDDDWDYYVVDFRGWSRRRIPISVAQEYYVLFASTVDRESQGTTVLFRRWEPLDNLTDGLPHFVGPTESSEDCSSFTRSSYEIRELHKYKHAPIPGERFDLEGRLILPLPLAGIPLNRMHPRKHGTRDELSLGAGRLLRLMVSNSRQRGSGFSDSDSASTSQSRPTSRISSTNRSRGRSASPRPQTYEQRRAGSTPITPAGRQRAIAKLEEECSMITYHGTIWSIPPNLDWDTSFYRDSILLFPDNRTLTRLRYWAACDPGISSMRQLLELAISRNMKFIMATSMSDLKTFKPITTPELSELTKRTYETGFQEEHLKDINGGAAFRDQYMGKLADILRRPQARALISMGGPTAWIAKRYGGPPMIQRFMDGPSTQVTVHHRGAVTSSPFYDEPLFHDQISAQEENLVHGFVPAENPEHHRWLFPTTEIMEDYCNHWRGEWTQGCDLIFHNIAKGLDRGTAKPLTRKGWKAYLHSPNHGTRRPAIVLTNSHFTRTDELLRDFPGGWHGRRIADIPIPIPFDSLDGN